MLKTTLLKAVGIWGRIPNSHSIAESIELGEELGHIMVDVSNKDNIKQKGGAVAALVGGLALCWEVLTLGMVHRMALYVSPLLIDQPPCCQWV